MKKFTLLTLNFIFFGFFNAQELNTLWQKSYGGSDTDTNPIILPKTDNSGFYLIGSSRSNTSGDKTEDAKGSYDIWLLEIDNDGNLVWDKTLGGNGEDIPTDAFISNDTIYVLASSQSGISGDKTTSNYGGKDVWLLALNSNGDLLFEGNYGGSGFESPTSMVLTNKNTILIASTSSSPDDGNKTTGTNGLEHAWFIEVEKTNAGIISQFNYSTSGWDKVSTLKKDSNGNIYIMAFTDGNDGDKTVTGYGNDDIWLIKLDDNYNEVSQAVFGGSSTEYYSESDLMIDGNTLYLLCSSQSDVSGNKTVPRYGDNTTRDFWVIKTDLNLNIEWDASFGGSSREQAAKIIKAQDRIVIAGGSRSVNNTGSKASAFYGVMDIWLVLLDEQGNEIIQTSYGGAEIDGVTSIYADNNDNLYLSAWSESGATGNKTTSSNGFIDYWLIKVDASTSLVSVPNNNSVNLSVFPNPFNTHLTFDLSSMLGEKHIEIYTVDGKLIHRKTINADKYYWHSDSEISNVYFYKITSDKHSVSGKLIRY